MKNNKKILLSILIPTIVISIAIILVVIFTTRKPFKEKYLTSKTEYNIISNKDFIINPIIYENVFESKLEKKENIETTTLKSNKTTKEITLLDVAKTKTTKEEYNKQEFYKKTYTFDLGKHTNNLYIPDARIEFVLKNGESYTFFIGSISIIIKEDVQEAKELLINNNEIFSYYEGQNHSQYRPKDIELSYSIDAGYTIESVSYRFENEIINETIEKVEKDGKTSFVLKIQDKDLFLYKIPLLIKIKNLRTTEITLKYIEPEAVCSAVFGDILECRGDLINEAVLSKNK